MVLCHSGVVFPQEACRFFKDTNQVLQFWFSHIILYHRPETVEGNFIHANLWVKWGDINGPFDTIF